MIEQTQPDQPPQEITAFLDQLHASGERIVPGSLLWLPHPKRPGWWVPGVMIEKERNDETKSQGHQS